MNIENSVIERNDVRKAYEIIGGKWKILILWELVNETNRFSQLQKKIDKITQKMLSQKLKELEKDGLVSREIFAEIPPRVEYSITEKGASLKTLMILLKQWGRNVN